MLAIRQLDAGLITASDLLLRAGEPVLLTGASGSGKSLFFQALADLIPWQGDVQLDGKLCHSFVAHDWRRQVMWVPAEPVWWAATVADHFTSSPDLSALDLSPELFTRKPDLLSSGQRQRLALLRALDRRPRVLLLDEPTANLDADNTARVEVLLRRWCAAGNSLILASHDIAQQQRWAQCHWQVQDGRVEVVV